MENWGLITYSENWLSIDNVLSSASSIHSTAQVIAHELAHQVCTQKTNLQWLSAGVYGVADSPVDHLDQAARDRFPRGNRKFSNSVHMK